MELVMMEWVRRRNLMTTETPTIYDFIAGSYTLFENDQKKWQQTPCAFRSKWLIGFHNEN